VNRKRLHAVAKSLR